MNIGGMEKFKGKRVSVAGMGVSNTPLIELLVNNGAIVTACDKNEKIDKDPWTKLGVALNLGKGYLDNIEADYLFRSPGIRPDALKLTSKEIVTSEMDLFFELCPCGIIGVTGSDGKTTTTTLIAKMLQEAGHTVHIGGNIGNPLLNQTNKMTPDDWAVVELSSFQLMDMKHSPDIAVITNISPNHLDWHKNMDEYVAAKNNIMSFQKTSRVKTSDNSVCGGIAVLNGDNDITKKMKANDAVSTLYFGQHMIENGSIQGILPISDILLKGWHNIENYMAAICAVRDLVPPEAIIRVARTFQGVAHRNELIGEIDGVKFYNDSIGSSPSRTVATLKSHEKKVILIAGGYDKKIPFTQLANELPKTAKMVFLIGHTAAQLRKEAEAIENHPPLIDAGDLFSAVKMAKKAADKGDIILLSPACASFDQFKNFTERGEAFKKIVKELSVC